MGYITEKTTTQRQYQTSVEHLTHVLQNFEKLVQNYPRPYIFI